MDPKTQLQESTRFVMALQRFDAANAEDPNQELDGGKPRPRELVYAERLTHWVERLAPTASEELRLAARCQHICRWSIPRESYPQTRAGYLKWREALKQFHASKAGEILRSVGYPEPTVARVQELNLKKGFPQDPESRVLEDALCLVFLEHQFEELAAKTPEEKMVGVLQKTWKKMTPAAQAAAKGLKYSARAAALMEKAGV